MSFRDSDDKLWNCLAGIVSDEGLRLYDLEVRSPGSLRVFIDVAQSTATPPAVELPVEPPSEDGTPPVRPHVTSGRRWISWR